MAYTRTTWADYPATTTPITATALNNIEQGIVTLDRYNGVYTNEAARDAAITSPAEGMTAYLTAPTVPAATGGAGTAFVPTGITTIYNGSVWVCVTPVGAFTQNSGSVTSTSMTATLTGSPGINPSVTLVTGTTAIITLTSLLYNSGVNVTQMGVAVSGATTLAASTTIGYVITTAQVAGVECTRQVLLSGLTAGTNTFTLNYRVAAGTGTFEGRTITVQGIA